MKEASTVAEWIEALKELPPDLPLYVRSKYTGMVEFWEDHPVHVKGLSEMMSGEVGKPHACILY